MLVRELLISEDKWTKGAGARSINQQIVATNSPNAVCWCIFGALDRCYPNYNNWLRVYVRINKELGKDMMAWNDEPERTFEDVRHLVEKLDI